MENLSKTMNRQQLYELLRLDPRKVADPVEFWALYATSFYERLFAKVDDPDLVEKMYNHLKQSPKLNRKAVEALTFFYKLRMDELENPDFWDRQSGKIKENMKAKFVNENNDWEQSRDHLYNRIDYDELEKESSGADLLWRVSELDQDGRRAIRHWGIWKAANADEARQLAADHYKNKEMVTTGFYEAREIEQSQLDEERQRLERAISDLKLMNESLNESMSRYCDIYKTNDGKWYMDLANEEYGEWDDCTTYGPFNSEEAADRYLSDNHSNPGGMGVDDSGDREVPTESPNGSRVVNPRSGGGGRMMMGGYGRRW